MNVIILSYINMRKEGLKNSLKKGFIMAEITKEEFEKFISIIEQENSRAAADVVSCEPKEIKEFLNYIYAKLGVQNRIQALIKLKDFFVV